jgi:hypothetical protein
LTIGVLHDLTDKRVKKNRVVGSSTGNARFIHSFSTSIAVAGLTRLYAATYAKRSALDWDRLYAPWARLRSDLEQ